MVIGFLASVLDSVKFARWTKSRKNRPTHLSKASDDSLRGSEAKPFGFESSDLHASKENSVEPHFLPLPILKSSNFHPFAPLGTVGIVSASASIFFTFVGFDAVATAAEEKKQPQRNVPPGYSGRSLQSSWSTFLWQSV